MPGGPCRAHLAALLMAAPNRAHALRAAFAAAAAAVVVMALPAAASASSSLRLIREFPDYHVGQTVAVGDDLYFTFTDGRGRELWRSDGTSEGTRLVRDINPGAGSGEVAALTRMGDRVVFTANDGVHGDEPWISDGTAAGTTMLKDIAPVDETGKQPPAGYRMVAGALFFFADDSVHGHELWRSDGTAAGTKLVRDINPGPGWTSRTQELEVVGSNLFFLANGGDGFAVWRSDGTAAGTAQVSHGNIGVYSSNPEHFERLGASLYFTAYDGAGVSLYRATGSSNAERITQLPSGASELTAVGDVLFFAALDDQLWRSDGTAAGTVRLRDLEPGWHGSAHMLTELTAVGDQLFFRGVEITDCGWGCFPAPEYELWASDGTPLGTRRVKDIWPGVRSANVSQLTVFHGRVVFAAWEPTHGWALWRSDGTDSGTVLVRDLDSTSTEGFYQWSPIRNLTPAGDGLFLTNPAGLWYGLEPTPGTGGGTPQELCPDGRPRRVGDTNCDGFVRIAVLGDSFISGEGAAQGGFPYRDGTDENGLISEERNLCHRSEQSWAVRLARRLAPSARIEDFDFSTSTDRDVIAFLACSGAVTDNLDGVRTSASQDKSLVQYRSEGDTQFTRLRRMGSTSFDVVLLSIGGNDAGFADVIQTCLLNRCLKMTEWRDERLERLQPIGDRLAKIAADLRSSTMAPGAEIYWVNYPDPLKPPPGYCPSFGVEGVAAGMALGGVAGGYVGASHDLKLDPAEREWMADQFLERLNGRIRAAANAGGAHLIDVSDAFLGHPICGDLPFANGLIGGDDKLGAYGYGLIGNESFHPNALGQARMRAVAESAVGLGRFGSNPNPAGLPVESFTDPNSITAYVTGSNPDTDVIVASGSATVVITDGPPNTVIVVPTFSLGTVAGRATTDGEGNATIPIRLPPTTAPGLHHAEIWTESGDRLAAVPIVVTAGAGCTGGPDRDGDLLADDCDMAPSDGPRADADGDGIANAADGCPLVTDPVQADADHDGEGDACDTDLGADLIETGLLGPPFPGAVAPSAPQDVSVQPQSGHTRVSWDAPLYDGGSPITGYRITRLGGGAAVEVGASQRTADLPALSPGTTGRFALVAVNAAGGGAVAIVEATGEPGTTPPEDPGPTPPDPDDQGGGAPTPPGNSTPSGDTPSQPTATLTLRRSTVRVDRRWRVRLPASCEPSGPACTGRVTLTRRPGLKAKRMRLGSARVGMPAGTTTKLLVKLSPGGRRLISKHSRLRVEARIKVNGRITTKALVLKAF